MKLRGIFLAIAIAAFSTVASAQQHFSSTSTASTAIVQRQKFQVFTPFTFRQQPVAKNKIERWDGLSSRPWTQIVGASAFPTAETHESKLYILWIGHEPWQ